MCHLICSKYLPCVLEVDSPFNPPHSQGTTQAEHGATPAPTTLQDHLHPRFLGRRGLRPTSILVNLLLLAAQQTQKELDFPPRNQGTDPSGGHTVTFQDWCLFRPRQFVGGSTEGVGAVQFEVRVGTRTGEGGYCRNGGRLCGESEGQVSCCTRLLDFERGRQVVCGARESP